jgi:hypothetical protein
VPATLRKDGRSRPPHLRTWRDGWRHLRFLMVFAPGKMLVLPGTVLTVLGLAATIALELGGVRVGNVRFDVSALVYACLALVIGVQTLLLGGCAVATGVDLRAGPARTRRVLAAVMRLELLVAFGLVMIVAGMVGTGKAVALWRDSGFADLQPDEVLRIVLPSATAIAIGVTAMFSSLVAGLVANMMSTVGRPAPLAPPRSPSSAQLPVAAHLPAPAQVPAPRVAVTTVPQAPAAPRS